MNRSDWTFTNPKNYSFVSEFELVCKKTSYAALVSSSYYIGGLLGTVSSGSVSDAYGRKPVLLISLSLLICTSIGCSFVTSVWQLIFLNIFRGIASVANYYTCYVYLSEYSTPRLRVIFSSILISATSTSYLLMDLFAYYERNWRALLLYASFPAIPCLIILYLLPESARWLLATGKKQEATAILDKISKFNGSTTEVGCVHLKSPTTSNERKYNYLDLLRNFKVLKVTMSVLYLWFVIALVYWVIVLGSGSLGGNIYETFAISTSTEYVAAIICALLLDRIGRKKAVLGGLFISGTLMGIMMVVPRSLSSRHIVNMALSAAGRFTLCLAFDAIIIWTSELFPTVVRSQGMSASVLFARLSTLCSPFITRVLQSISETLPLIVMCVLAISATIVGLVLPETNNRPTREIYEDFEMATTSFPRGIDNSAHD